jgi:hypothetical protein
MLARKFALQLPKVSQKGPVSGVTVCDYVSMRLKSGSIFQLLFAFSFVSPLRLRSALHDSRSLQGKDSQRNQHIRVSLLWAIYPNSLLLACFL